MYCLSTTKIVGITCFSLESYKNTRTKKKDHPLGGLSFWVWHSEIGLEPNEMRRGRAPPATAGRSRPFAKSIRIDKSKANWHWMRRFIRSVAKVFAPLM